MLKFVTIICLTAIFVYPQSLEYMKGNISFISSRNIYVRFENTEGIKAGDTLYYKTGNLFEAVIEVKYISSTSAAGEKINQTDLIAGSEIYAKLLVPDEDTVLAVNNINLNKPASYETAQLKIRHYSSPDKEKFNGRFSVQSYSNYSNGEKQDYQRWRYTLSLSAKNINGSPVSVQTYLNFNYRADEWNIISRKPAENFKVYDLALKYEISDRSFLLLGRHLNAKITNISTIDGVQYQAGFGKFDAGVFAGSRPDYSSMGYNFKLFQAGFYLNRTDLFENKMMDNTVAFVEQTNNFKTDRRLIYFQHTNNIIENLPIFISAEADLYKKINNQSKNELSLTGLFVSGRYSPFNYASVNLSYDARRNVIYYETFKNYIDDLIENEMRQGLRGGINIRPFEDLSVGINAGYRFRKGDLATSNDIGAYLRYASLPLLAISPSLSFTRIKGSYISGNIFGVMIYRSTGLMNSYISFSYRYSDYFYSRKNRAFQSSLSADISASIMKLLSVGIGWEGIFEKKRTAGRILIDITARL